MVALYVKGSRIIVGKNDLIRPATTMNASYPDIAGVHCELSCYYKNPQMRGGTIYVAGRKASSSSIMMNSRPCRYCAALLQSTRTNWIVFVQEGTFVKARIEDL